MVYKNFRYRAGTGGFGVPAQTAGETIESIRKIKGENFAPQDLVNAARPTDSPMHPAFEWNNKVAAEEYRKVQAQEIIRAVHVVRDEAEIAENGGPKYAQAYVSIGNHEGKSTYTAMSRALSDADLRRQVLEDAIALLKGVQRRFQHIEELKGVWTALDGIKVG